MWVQGMVWHRNYIYDTCEYLLEKVGWRKYKFPVILDFSAAFNTIDHWYPFKLLLCGWSGSTVYQWFFSFLRDDFFLGRESQEICLEA